MIPSRGSLTHLAANTVAIGILLAGAIYLLVSAFVKFADVPSFAEALLRQGLLSTASAPTVAWLVPMAEAGVAFIAIWRLLTVSGSRYPWLLCAVAYASLAAYAGALVLHPPAEPAPCGCLGGSAEPADWGNIAVKNTGAALALGLAPLLLIGRGVGRG